MALVRRIFGCAANPFEILDKTDDEDEVMNDSDSLLYEFDDNDSTSRTYAGRNEFFYAYDDDEELRQLLVVPDLGSVIEALQLCKQIGLDLHTIARDVQVGNPGLLETLLQAPNFVPPEIRIALLGDIGQGKSSIINSLLNCPDAALTVSGNATFRIIEHSLTTR